MGSFASRERARFLSRGQDPEVDELLPVLVAKTEMNGRFLLEIEIDATNRVLDPSADAGRGELVGQLLTRVTIRCRPFHLPRAGLRFRRGGPPGGALLAAAGGPGPGFLFAEHRRRDDPQVVGPSQPGAVAALLRGEEEAAGRGRTGLPTVQRDGAVRPQDQPSASS